MFKKLIFLFTTIALTACGSDDNSMEVMEPVFAASQTYTIELNGAQQVPNNRSDATATATLELDETLNLFKASLDLTNVADVSAAHIHAGGIGMNGDVVYAFEQDDSGNYIVGETALTAMLASQFSSGDFYINVHTTAFPDGEVRGQIVNANTTILTFSLSGQQEVPAVETTANGYAYASYDTASTLFKTTVRTSGVEDATMAHIHTGRIGSNGDVLVALEQVSADVNIWTTPNNLTLDEEIFEVLASGGHYVNVHTPANPSGELRGQILTANYVIAAFDLAGQQEVPAVSTTATGSGYALIDTDTLSLELKAVTSGVADATMAHIHTGRIGMNGSVLVGLEQSMDDRNVWMTPADLSIDADTFEVLASGGHYVNVHTPANPSGELRGQILTANYVIAAFDLAGQQEVPAVSTTA
ncbi:MAG: CHRD domain-containing protein, partial [Glaciecola sp.]